MSIRLKNPGLVRSGGITALAAIFVLGSAGCELFGGGEETDGGSETVELSDALKAEVISAAISSGFDALSSTLSDPVARQAVRTVRGAARSPQTMTAVTGCSGNVSMDTDDVATDGDAFMLSTIASCDASATGALEIASCSDDSQTYNVDAGWELSAGSYQMEFTNLDAADASITSLGIGFTFSGTFSGGELEDKVEVTCGIDLSLTPEEFAQISSGFDPIDCETDDLACSVGGEQLDCGQVKALLTDSLPASCQGE